MLLLGQNNQPVQISDMFAAEGRIRKLVSPTALISVETLNIQLGGKVYLKTESLLPSGAYKFRGAVNKITTLIEEYGNDIKIIAASSGNHGMACALAGKQLGVKVTIVVPEPTPEIKRACIRSLGAELLVKGATYDESFLDACALAEKDGMFYVHPVSDRFTVAGQGTISLELMEQLPSIDQIIVPIGGGGLITGISYVIKQLKPSVRIIGVMPEGSNVYYESRKAGKLITLDKCSTLADAVLRKTGEEYLFPYIEKYVDDIVVVTENNIKKAIKLGCLYGKLTLEGAAAMPLASLIEGKCQRTDNTVLVCSGGNIDQTVLDLCMKVSL